MRFAEECIDRQTRIDLFRGREIDFATGRVLLHTLDGAGRPLCGRDTSQLTPAASYLPHQPRCRGCAEAAGEPVQDGELPASGVDVRTAHGAADEHAAKAALHDVLAEHDLRRWMLTDLVTVDGTIRGGYSHPLTISAALLTRRPALTLTTFLHEQLHWLEGPGSEAASAEASERWPDPPPLSAGGGTDLASTWLHMSVCALEYFSLAEVLGPAAATDELRQHTGYSWIYGQILADPGWFSGFLDRHGLHVPAEPPVPRRYFGEPWWASPG